MEINERFLPGTAVIMQKPKGDTEDAIRSRLHKQKMKRGEFYEICNRSGNCSSTCYKGCAQDGRSGKRRV